MKSEDWRFLGCGTFFGGTDIVYRYTSKGPTGTAALALAVRLSATVGFVVEYYPGHFAH